MDQTDDAVVAFLRDRAPGLPTWPVDPRAVTSRAREALGRSRRRRRRTTIVAVAATITVYLGLAITGPMLPGNVNVPGGSAIRAAVAVFVPGPPPGGTERTDDVDRLDREVLPVVEELQVIYYLSESPHCRILEYDRGHFGDPECSEMTPFDAQALADFARVTHAVERAGVTLDRILWDGDGVKFALPDSSWQYNYEYVYRPYVETPPDIRWPGEEQWTLVRAHWWFHRAHDD